MSTKEHETTYLSVSEAALELRCSASLIRRRVADGDLPACKLGPAPNSPIRIPADALSAWAWSEPVDEAA